MVIKGVIRPPPEIRAVADKTALYVAKNGRAFEARILNSDKGKMPKFAFLQLTSPFHAYYEDRLAYYEEIERNGKENGGLEEEGEGMNGNDGGEEADGGAKGEKDEKERNGEDGDASVMAKKAKPRKTQRTQKSSVIDPIAKIMLNQRLKISQARAKKEEEEMNEKAEGLNEASNGIEEQKQKSSFPPLSPPPPLELTSIVAPSSLSAVQIETIQLVAQYTAMDGKGGPFLSHLTIREWTNPEFAFCQPRHAHFAYFSALVDAYRKIMSMLTGTANEETASEKGPLVSKSDVQKQLEQAAYRAEYGHEMKRLRSQQAQEESELLAIDWHDFVVVETIDFSADEAVELSMLPPPPPPPQTKSFAKVAEAAQLVDGDGMEESDDEEEDDEPIRVVPSYTPVVVGTSNPQNARAIDPITGRSVAVADIPEHLRIQLLDPKWAEERKKFQEKQKDSNLVSGDAIASNISRFAQARGDLFGKSEQELLSNAKDSKKRLEEANRVIREQAALPPPPAIVQKPPVTLPALSQSPIIDAAVGNIRKVEADSSAEPPPKRTRIIAPPPVPQPHDEQPASTPPAFDPIAVMDPMDLAEELLPPLSGAAGGRDDIKGSNLLSEADFVASLSKPEVTLQIRIPNDPSHMAWNFYGQILSMSVNVMSKVDAVKVELSKSHLNGMPPNKIQFKDPNIGFLKGSNTLASLNIGPTATLDMSLKTRGGRK